MGASPLPLDMGYLFLVGCNVLLLMVVQNDLCSFPRQTIQYHSNPSLCPNQWCWRGWSWTVLSGPIRTSRTNTPKRCPFHYRRVECKRRKSRDTWSNRHIWPWSTKWSRAKANRVLLRNTHHSKHPLPIPQEKTLHMDITRWSISKSDWLYSLQLKMRISIESAKTKQELIVAQIMNSLLPNSDLNWRK